MFTAVEICPAQREYSNRGQNSYLPQTEYFQRGGNISTAVEKISQMES